LTLDTRPLLDQLNQVLKVRPPAPRLFAVRANQNAGKDDFFVSALSKLADLLDHLDIITAVEPWARVRNAAIRTHHAASILNLDSRSRSPNNSLRRTRRSAAPQNRTTSRKGREEATEGLQLYRVRDEKVGGVESLTAVEGHLRRTAGNDNLRIWVLARSSAHRLPTFALRLSSYAARIDNVHIRDGIERHDLEPGALERLENSLGFVLIDFAA
jgi:hypothetical protein